MRISEADIERFTKGDCHILAHALHLRTGWPIHAFVEVGGIPAIHAFVVTPTGYALDIKGAVALAEFEREWGVGAHLEVDWHEIRREWPTLSKYSYTRARLLAPALVAQAKKTCLLKTSPEEQDLVALMPSDVRAFALGASETLAREMNALSGWPVHSVHDEYALMHSFVVAPGGYGVNISGLSTMKGPRGCVSDLPKSWRALRRKARLPAKDIDASKRASELAPFLIAEAEQKLHVIYKSKRNR